MERTGYAIGNAGHSRKANLQSIRRPFELSTVLAEEQVSLGRPVAFLVSPRRGDRIAPALAAERASQLSPR